MVPSTGFVLKHARANLGILVGAVLTASPLPGASQTAAVLPSRTACEKCELRLERVMTLGAEGNLVLESQITLLGDGRVLAAPTGDPAGVAVFDRTGRYLRTFGRRGAGPGEFEVASRVFGAPDGGAWVLDGDLRRITVFDDSLHVQYTFPTRGTPADVAFRGKDTAVVHVERETPLEVVVGGGVAARMGRGDRDDIYTWFRRVAVAADGTIWLARRDRYELESYGWSGEAGKKLTADLDWFRPPSERPQGSGAGTAYVVDLEAAEDGTLWLAIGRRKPDANSTGAPTHSRPARLDLAELLQAWDWLIEIVDPAIPERRVSADLEGRMPGGLLPGGMFYTYSEDRDGIVTIDVWRARVVQRDMKTGGPR